MPLLRFRPDPTQGDPDERYFQYIRGLMNITSPMAAGGGGSAGGPEGFRSWRAGYLARMEYRQPIISAISADGAGGGGKERVFAARALSTLSRGPACGSSPLPAHWLLPPCRALWQGRQARPAAVPVLPALLRGG